MALRLRYEIDTPSRIREHVHVVDGKGYFFFPGANAPQGTPAWLELDFTISDQTLLLCGQVWAQPSSGGVWLELPGVPRALEALQQRAERSDRRLSSEQLVLAESPHRPALLCRVREVSEGGARLAVARGDLGAVGERLRVLLPEAGPTGAQLQAMGEVVWISESELGLRWSTRDLASRAAARRLMELAREDWDGARSAVHPRSCKCLTRSGSRPALTLLG